MVKPVKVTQIDLQNEIAATLVSEGASDPPVDFRDLNNPLRIEVETLLAKIAKPVTAPGKPREKEKKEKKKERNLDRRATVELYMRTYYPNNKKLERAVMGDLTSYKGWEYEVDDA